MNTEHLIIDKKYFAVADVNGEIQLVVENISDKPDAIVKGLVINGAWEGLFSEHWLLVENDTVWSPCNIVWQSDEIKFSIEDKYGIDYVRSVVG